VTRVAFVVYGPLAQRTGGYLYDALVIDELAKRGVAVDVVEIARGEPADAIARRIARRMPDAVVGDELCFAELAELFPALSCPRALLVHHLTSWEGSHDPREDACLDVADAIVATSARTAERLGRPGVVVAEPGADRLPRRARATPAPGDPVRLLFVGSLVPRKNALALVSAFDAASAGGDARLLMIGEPRDEAYAARVRERAVASRGVTLAEGAPDDFVAEALASSDALVLPSSLEGYGMVLTEALHAGTPVIVSRAAAVPPAVIDGETALVHDGGELEDALERFLGDAALRERLREGAARVAPRLRSWRETGEALHAAIELAITRARTCAGAAPR
jgi:glycosyltransferase involved in cell wall biosynthesis